MTLLQTSRTATLVRAARVTDRRGDAADDWTNAERRTLPGAWVQQTSSTETRDPRDATVTRWVLFCTDPDVRARDRIEVPGRLFEVDGKPNLIENRGGYHHTEANLVLLEGE